MKKTRSLVRFVIGSALLMAAVLFNFGISAKTELTAPVVAERSISPHDLPMKIEISPGQKIKYHHFYSAETYNIILNDLGLSDPNSVEPFYLALLLQPPLHRNLGSYQPDTVNHYQSLAFKSSKNYDRLKVAMRSYSF